MKRLPTGIREALTLLSLASLVLLAACGPTTYFKHELRLTIHGRPYDFIHYYKCSSSTSLSEADMRFHSGLRATGAGEIVEDVGEGLLLRYIVADDCFIGPNETKTDILGRLINSNKPVHIYDIFENLNAPGVAILSQTITPVPNGNFDIGESKAESVLRQSVCKLPKYYFTVTAYVTPEDAWAGSDKAKDYFSRLKSVTSARIGEAWITSGRADMEVRFPDFQDRHYSKSTAQGGIDFGRPVQFDLVDGAFRPLPRDTDLLNLGTYAVETNTDGSVNVNYKGTLITVFGLKEIYDPDTKEILLLSRGVSEAVSPLTCMKQ